MKTQFLKLTTLLVILGVLLSACAQPTQAPSAPAAEPTAAAAPVAEATKAPETAPTQPPPTATQAPTPVPSAADLDPATYGLKPGKPYDGTKLKFLVCCPTAQQFYSLNQKSNEFTDMTGISVEWGKTPFGSFLEEVVTETATGGGNSDLMAWVDNWGYGLQQYITPLDDFIKEANIDLADYPEAYLAPGRNKDGQQFGLPLRGHAYTLFYRKDVFDKLGLKVPTTFAELEEAAKVIEAQTDLRGIAPVYGINAGQNLFMWFSLLWANGGDLFDENYKPIFNNEAGVQALQRYVDWLQKLNIAPEASRTFNEQDALNEVVQGRAAMFIGWSWMYSNLINPKTVAPEALGNVAFAEVPGWEGKGKPATYGYIWLMGISQFSKNPDAAKEYLKWLASAHTDKRVVLDKSDPKVSNVVTTHYSVMRDPEVNKVNANLHENMAKVLENARNQPLVAEWPQIQSILEIAVNDAANGKPVQETLDKAAAEVGNVLKAAGY